MSVVTPRRRKVRLRGRPSDGRRAAGPPTFGWGAYHLLAPAFPLRRPPDHAGIEAEGERATNRGEARRLGHAPPAGTGGAFAPPARSPETASAPAPRRLSAPRRRDLTIARAALRGALDTSTARGCLLAADDWLGRNQWARAKRALLGAHGLLAPGENEIHELVARALQAVDEIRLLNAAMAPPGERWDSEVQARQALEEALARTDERLPVVRGAA